MLRPPRKCGRVPRDKWLGHCEFDANTNINLATINTLATGDWVRRGQLLCLIGDSGTGKLHLLIGFGTAAAEKGFRVKYTLVAHLGVGVRIALERGPGSV